MKKFILISSALVVCSSSVLAETKDIASPEPLLIFTPFEQANQEIKKISEFEKLKKIEETGDKYCQNSGFERINSVDAAAVHTTTMEGSSSKTFYFLGTLEHPVRAISKKEFDERKREGSQFVFQKTFSQGIGSLIFDRLVCYKRSSNLDANSCVSTAPSIISKEITNALFLSTPIDKSVQQDTGVPQAAKIVAPPVAKVIAPPVEMIPGLKNAASISFNNKNGHFSGTCTGSLIAEDIILTAAHCFDTLTSSGEGIPTVVKVGNPPENRAIVDYKVHADYVNMPGGDAYHKLKDLALIRITPAPKSAKVIPLIRPSEINGIEAIQFHGLSAGKSMAIEGTSFNKTTENHGVYGISKKEYLNRILLPKLARVPRPGDSGGPLYVKKNNQWFIAGTLLGDGGAFGGHGTGATEITAAGNYQDWIDHSIQEMRNPKVQFRAMNGAEFSNYLPHGINAYKKDLVQFANATSKDASRQAHMEFDAFFHQGLKTPGVVAQKILNAQGKPIGHVLYKKMGNVVHLFDVELVKESRGQGIGKQVMEALESQLKQDGAQSVKLWVLRQNIPALKLYEKLGYKTKQDAGPYQKVMEKRLNH